MNNTRTPASTPSTSWPSNTSQVSKLLYNPSAIPQNGGVGPNAIFKVMAGDKITAKANYFYQPNGVSNNGNGIMPNIITSIIGALSGTGPITSAVKDNITSSYLSSSAILNPFPNTYQPTPTNNTTPKAYLKWIFFDEQFNYVEEKSGATLRLGSCLTNQT